MQLKDGPISIPVLTSYGDDYSWRKGAEVDSPSLWYHLIWKKQRYERQQQKNKGGVKQENIMSSLGYKHNIRKEETGAAKSSVQCGL